jgi:hypothetical protein
MDADQLGLKITGHVVTPVRVLEGGWIDVRSEIVAGLGPAAPSRDGHGHCPEKWTEPDDIAVGLTAAVIRLDEELAPGPRP